jgi:hypothetical protein
MEARKAALIEEHKARFIVEERMVEDAVGALRSVLDEHDEPISAAVREDSKYRCEMMMAGMQFVGLRDLRLGGASGRVVLYHLRRRSYRERLAYRRERRTYYRRRWVNRHVPFVRLEATSLPWKPTVGKTAFDDPLPEKLAEAYDFTNVVGLASLGKALEG